MAYWENIYAYRISVGKPEPMTRPEELRSKWEVDIKMYFKEKRWGRVKHY
jgi:predicted alternative tryptophan synthase beta-subunit